MSSQVQRPARMFKTRKKCLINELAYLHVGGQRVPYVECASCQGKGSVTCSKVHLRNPNHKAVINAADAGWVCFATYCQSPSPSSLYLHRFVPLISSLCRDVNNAWWFSPSYVLSNSYATPWTNLGLRTSSSKIFNKYVIRTYIFHSQACRFYWLEKQGCHLVVW